jgi:Fe-S cluster assembly iron-binding protein IscA
MFEITEKATEMIKEAFRGQEKIPSIRVAYNQGG